MGLNTILISQVAETTEVVEYENFWANGKEVGINVTNLASRFIPFNLTDRENISQFIALKTKWYGNTRAFVINFGANIDNNGPDNLNKIFLSIGYEKRRNVSNKWKYTTGWELVATNLNSSSIDNSPYLGISKPFGIEYHFYDNFYLSTEARLTFGFGEDFNFNLAYPTSIFFNMLLE